MYNGLDHFSVTVQGKSRIPRNTPVIAGCPFVKLRGWIEIGHFQIHSKMIGLQDQHLRYLLTRSCKIGFMGGLIFSGNDPGRKSVGAVFTGIRVISPWISRVR